MQYCLVFFDRRIRIYEPDQPYVIVDRKQYPEIKTGKHIRPLDLTGDIGKISLNSQAPAQIAEKFFEFLKRNSLMERGKIEIAGIRNSLPDPDAAVAFAFPAPDGHRFNISIFAPAGVPVIGKNILPLLSKIEGYKNLKYGSGRNPSG